MGSLERAISRETTAFNCACYCDKPGCIEVLVRAGCDTTAKNKNELIGKQMAEQRGYTAVLERVQDL